MKKFFMVLAAVVAMGFAANAQDNALGLRFGGGNGYGAELSYQKGLGANRLELDLGLSNNSNDNYFHLTGMYQWNWNISGGWNWYVGPGAQLGYCSNHGFGLSVGGQLGIEYKFSIPLMISLDIRPLWNVVRPDKCAVLNRAYGLDGSLSVRYCF